MYCMNPTEYKIIIRMNGRYILINKQKLAAEIFKKQNRVLSNRTESTGIVKAHFKISTAS